MHTMMRKRTPAQRAADTFDGMLYKLICDAQMHAHNLKSDRGNASAWDHVGNELRSIRPRVREMMHADDLAGTE